MTLPITGPYSRTVSRPEMFITISGYRQRKPYNLPLAYSNDQKLLVERYAQNIGHLTETDPPANGAVGSGTQPYTQRLGWYFGDAVRTYAVDSARSRFVSQMRGEAAELAVALAERKQAVSMMASRATQMYSFVRALRKFRFAEAAKILGVTSERRKRLNLRRESKAFANNYLEFHFGWSPLISDIGNVVNLLQGEIAPLQIVGRGRYSAVNRVSTTSGWPYYNTDLYTHDLKAKSVVQAQVEITNPNLYLANKLGFTNPATVAWELVPFSFVVDWFVNVSDFLEQFSEFHGLTVKNAFYTAHVNDLYYHRETYPSAPYPGGQAHSCTMKGVSTRRTLGIPSVSLGVRRPWTFSVRRGLAAISLLIQQGFK